MSKKYIYACVRVPMEVMPDGKYEPCTDRMQITFERCDELPPVIDPLENNNLMAVLSSFTEPELIPKHLIKHNTRSAKYNRTFKQRQRNTNRFSVKNFSLEITDDLRHSLTPLPGESAPDAHTYPNSSLV
jgi:hypothetical protein